MNDGSNNRGDKNPDRGGSASHEDHDSHDNHDNHDNHDDDNRRIGKWMIIGFWVFGLIIGTAFVHNRLERSRNPNNDVVTSVVDGKRSITLERSGQGHYVVTGTINGATAEFLVDTGATSVSVPVDVARAAGLKRGAEIPIITANGRAIAYATRIDRLRMGDLEIRNVTAHINPGLSDDVLLGMSVLKHYELVQRGNTLIIREP